MVLEQIFGHLLGKRRWGDGAMRDLDISLRAKGSVSPVEDAALQRCSDNAHVGRFLCCAHSYLGAGFLALSLAARPVQHLPAIARPTALLMLGYYCGCVPFYLKMDYYEVQRESAILILNQGEEHTKMELAKIILNNHSTDKSLVDAVKRHFVADHVFSDQHQEKQLLRWLQRDSYVDSTFMDRMKEYEANNSDDGATSSVNIRLLEKDQQACLLRTPGNNTEVNKPSEHIGDAVLMR